MKVNILKLFVVLLLHLIPIANYASYDDGKDFFMLGKKSLDSNNLDSTAFYFQKALVLAAKLPDSIQGLAKANYSMGVVYHNAFYYDKALLYLLASLKELEGKPNSAFKSDVYNQIGILHYDQQHYVPALEYLLVAFKISTTINDKESITLINNNLGLVFMETKDYASARTYFNTCINMAGENHYLKSLSLINIGLADYYEKEYDSALQLLNKAEKETIISNKLFYLPSIYLNQGLCYFELGDFSKAKTLFLKALSLFKENRNIDLEYLCKINLYNISFLNGDYNIANEFKSDIIASLDTIHDVSIKVDFQTYLSNNCLSEGDSIGALTANLKLVEYGEVILTRLENQSLIDLKSDVSYLKVSSDLSLLTEENELIQKEKQLVEQINSKLQSSNRLIILLTVATLLLAASFIFYLIQSNKKKKEKNLLLEQQRTELSIKNKEILNSFEYANGMEKLLLQQMNPHFLFNALTTVEASIAVGEIEFAKDYISMFAALLRKTLNHSRQDVISLPDEIEFLESYIKLNSIKQGENFSYQLIYDEDHVEDFVCTPPMLVQPFVENALIHGLYHKTDGEKTLTIEVIPKDDFIIWTITDNGVGREKSKEIGKTHKGVSHGIKITKDRIKWMKNIYGNNFSVEYIDLEIGTKVILKTPIVEG